MDSLLATVQQWHVHPVVDHFTVALLITGVVIDLVGSLLPKFRWIRYMALTLMILGALAALGSWESGGWEAHKVHNLVSGEAKTLLHRHAELGDWMAGIFVVLALWRVVIEAFGFAAGSRSLYLIVAVIATLLLCYQGYLGGEMVYDYGVGTALMTPTPGVSPTPQAVPTPLPTVYMPPSNTPTATASAGAPSPSPAPASASPAPSPSPAATPSP